MGLRFFGADDSAAEQYHGHRVLCALPGNTSCIWCLLARGSRCSPCCTVTQKGRASASASGVDAAAVGAAGLGQSAASPPALALLNAEHDWGGGGGVSAYLQSQPAPHEQDFSHLGQPMVGWLGAEEQGTLANPS